MFFRRMYLSFESVIFICCLYLSFETVDFICRLRREEEGGEGEEKRGGEDGIRAEHRNDCRC